MYLPYQLLNTESRTLVSAPAQCVEALALILVSQDGDAVVKVSPGGVYAVLAIAMLDAQPEELPMVC